MSASELRQGDIAFQANLYESNNPTRRWLHNARRDWVVQALSQVASAQAHFFEVGIGCGIYTQLLANYGQVFATDVNGEFVAAASQLPNVVAQVSDITVDRFEPVHDVALCSEVLEHLPDSSLALKNIFDSLKPGGYLILTTPNSYSTVELTARLLSFGPIARLACIVYGEPVDDLGHINRMTRSQLRTQIDRTGFEIVRHDNIAFYLPVIAEFGGKLGARICQWFAHKLAATRFASLLWTQCWILRRPTA